MTAASANNYAYRVVGCILRVDIRILLMVLVLPPEFCLLSLCTALGGRRPPFFLLATGLSVA